MRRSEAVGEFHRWIDGPDRLRDHDEVEFG
jgi:hypothetical protein